MKLRFVFSGIIISMITTISMGEAAFVKYIDRSGKEHYVNTDYTKVPAEYQDQVRDQLNDATKNPADSIPNASNQIINAVPPKITDLPKPNLQKVEVFIAANCKDCERLETLLKANKIEYMHYDVESTSMGKDFYSTMQNETLPITRIGDRLIRGNDISTIKNVLETPELSKSEDTGVNNETQTEQNELNIQN